MSAPTVEGVAKVAADLHRYGFSFTAEEAGARIIANTRRMVEATPLMGVKAADLGPLRLRPDPGVNPRP